MTSWAPNELAQISDADELNIAAVRSDGTLRGPRPIWVVRVLDDLYVRAAYGRGSGWHRVAKQTGRAHISAGGVEKDVAVEPADDRVLDQVDDAYRAKYGARYASIVASITDPEHRASTLRLEPQEPTR